jgi:preprotein translocase subunit YajC
VPLLIVLVLGLVVMYVLMIRPQRQRQAQHQAMIDALGVGEDVLTTGGIYGTVSHVEGDDLVVDIADGVSVHMTRRGIAAVLPPEDDEDEEEDAIEDEDEDEGAEVVDEDEDEDEDAEVVDEDELDEVAVASGEESVTGTYDHDSQSGDRR